jgi:hypothetical protein
VWALPVLVGRSRDDEPGTRDLSRGHYNRPGPAS